ncbi:MAG: ribonuclease P protein component [Bacilli bacterium]|nr:ribonuclease P protein component [Bacilli bacterium]
MKKINIIKESTEYSRIIKEIQPFKYKEYLIFLEKKNNQLYKFGFSISKKICNAVKRNKIKRQLKDIIDAKDYKNDFNCIIMVRRSILDIDYETMKKDLYHCFEKLDIYKGDKNE